MCFKAFPGRVDGRLGVEGIEHGFDHEQIHAAGQQPLAGFIVGRAKRLEIDVAQARVIDVGRNRRGAVGWSKDTSHQAGGGALSGRAIVSNRFVSYVGCGLIKFPHNRFQAVVGLRNTGGVEGVGFNDVCTGMKKRRVDPLDQFWLGETQEVVVAL